VGAPRRLERAGANDGFVSAWTDLRKEQGPHLFDFGEKVYIYNIFNV